MGLRLPGEHDRTLETRLSELKVTSNGLDEKITLMSEQISTLAKQNEKLHNITQDLVALLSAHVQSESKL
jgi:hypothetical protein